MLALRELCAFLPQRAQGVHQFEMLLEAGRTIPAFHGDLRFQAPATAAAIADERRFVADLLLDHAFTSGKFWLLNRGDIFFAAVS